MTAPRPTAWTIAAELLVELDPPDADGAFRVEGLPGVSRARARIVPVGTTTPVGPHLRLRPLVDPPGPFGVKGIVLITPFVEAQADRTALIEFEHRIGPRYYEFLLGARYRYAATCAVAASGVELAGTCAEVYSIDAATRDEAIALDKGNEAPTDILAIYEECGAFIAPGTHSSIWLTPGRRLTGPRHPEPARLLFGGRPFPLPRTSFDAFPAGS